MSELRTILERASNALPPSARDLESLHHRADRRRRTKRMTAGVVALIVAAAGTVTAFTAFGSGDEFLGTGGTARYVDERHGWSMEYPEDWRLQVTESDAFEGEFEGALVSNIDHEFEHPDLGPNRSTTLWDMRGLPAGLVVVDVRAHMGGIGGPANPAPFNGQLSLDEFEEADLGEHAYGAPQPVKTRVIESGGVRYTIWVYIGREGGASNHEAAAEIVASIAFPGRDASSDCDAPSFRPTYLPWLGEGELVPEPRESIAKTGDRIFTWDGPEGSYVSLVRHAEVIGAGVDTDGSIRVRGYPAWLQWIGDPGVGELALMWEEASTPCEGYSLRLLLPAEGETEADYAEIQENTEAELLRIGESLAEG
jgi:hypothetical protein